MLYVKLFILMGGTWLLEVLSWAIEGPEWVWLLPDILNCSRGVLIFYICVWSNTKVKKSLLKRIGFINAQNSSIKSRSSNSKASDVTHSPNDSAVTALQQTKQEEVVNLMEDGEQQEHRV
jgi:G protein-coupled receptor Mth (Methuselah protein)